MTTESKSVVNQDLILAARKELIPVRERAWLGGFGNMFRKELGQWWGTKMGWIQLILWILFLNVITTFIMIDSASGAMTIAEQMEEVVPTILQMQMFIVAIGLVITVQGAVVGEKQLGTAAWVMSKPASRSAFIVAKAVSYVIGYGVTAVIIPSIIFLLETRFLFLLPVSIPHFLMGLGVVALDLLFYLMLTLMLGTIFNSRGPITGIGVGILLVGLLLNGMFPLEIQAVTPWLLPDVGVGLALQQPLPDIWFVPVVASVIWILVFSVVALWRFGREEF